MQFQPLPGSITLRVRLRYRTGRGIGTQAAVPSRSRCEERGKGLGNHPDSEHVRARRSYGRKCGDDQGDRCQAACTSQGGPSYCRAEKGSGVGLTKFAISGESRIGFGGRFCFTLTLGNREALLVAWFNFMDSWVTSCRCVSAPKGQVQNS